MCQGRIWVKPTVKLTGPFSSLVYSVTHNSLEVTNAEFLHKSGITFEVQDPETGKLVTRKAYAASNDDIRISGLRPNATYKIVVTMNYVDAKGNRRSELVREGDIVTTLGTEHLDALLLNWSNGPYLYTNKAELFNIQIKDFKENVDFYRWVCVLADNAMVAQKGDMVLCLIGPNQLYQQFKAAIEACGWSVLETLQR